MNLSPLYDTNTMVCYAPAMSRRSNLVYLVLLGFVVTGMALLPLIAVDISIHASGIIRPSQERTEVKPMVSGQIDTVYCREGAPIDKGAVMIRLKDDHMPLKKRQNRFEVSQHRQFIHDLRLLTGAVFPGPAVVGRLQSPVYRQQVSRFLHQQAGQEALRKKAGTELEMHRYLAREKVIAPKELYDKEIEHERQEAQSRALKTEQLGIWQQELSRYRLALSQLETEQLQLEAGSRLFLVTAPVSGTVQGVAGRYTGGAVQAGEPVCTISPETGLVAECYVTTRDAALLTPGQQVRFRIDAFNYNYFGMLTGNVAGIDDDFTLVDNEPVFKVRCSLHHTQLHIKSGYVGQLKKGMTLQADFMVARRTCWQLLFDTINDWVNPAVHKKASR